MWGSSSHTVWFVNSPGRKTWQILKNETHVYFISVMEIKYTWVFFYGSGPDTYAKEKKDAVIYESAFYPVYCGNG